MPNQPSYKNDYNSKTAWHDRGWFYVLVLILLMAGVFFVWYYYDSWLHSLGQVQDSHTQNNDSYDQLNTLFSGLGLAALVFTLLLQRRALVLQRKEFQNQILEMAGSREELKRQNALIEKQIYAKQIGIYAKARELKALWNMNCIIYSDKMTNLDNNKHTEEFAKILHKMESPDKYIKEYQSTS